MKQIRIPLTSLVSPKARIEYRDGNGKRFTDLVKAYASSSYVAAIEVCEASGGKYYIQNGVHRAKAAEMAGLKSINANVFKDSEPTGPKIPISKVQLPRQ